MLTIIAVFHIFIAIALILFVLLQDPKGDASGLMGGGGGGQSVFGATGAANFLVKATRTLAICFVLTCVYLAWHSTSSSNKSVLDLDEAQAESTLEKAFDDTKKAELEVKDQDPAEAVKSATSDKTEK